VLRVLCGVLALAPGTAAAQDLFELEVFEYETVVPGQFDVELHSNVLSGGAALPPSAAGNHRPAHVSIELARGWTERFESAIFIQTAPFGARGSARFAGGHLRGKVRVGELPVLPLRIALSAEYAFNRPAFDEEQQTLEVRTIVDYENGRLSLIANPSLELVTRGSSTGLEPVFDVSARAGWALSERLTLVSDYFSASASTRHLQPEPNAHHLLFGGADVEMGDAWELGVAAGHCITRSEPWLMRWTVGFSF
jgi:hypothetical protein